MTGILERIYITGAPGCGVTTLGAALAARLGAVHIDTDDHYWVATDPPFQVKYEIPERLRRIAAEQGRTGRWVLSGSCETWGSAALVGAQLVLFLKAPTEIRVQRLRTRERERFGAALDAGGALHDTHREFIAWTALYEAGTEPGRSRPRQENWLARLETPVLRLDATRPVAELVEEVVGNSISG